MKKRIIALVSLLVLLVSICAVSFAATEEKVYPYAKLYKYNKSVKVGETAHFWFELNSGSAYKKLDGAFRAKLNVLIKSKTTGKTIGAANWLWTGYQKYKCNAKIKSNIKPGKYFVKFRTYKREDANSAWVIAQKMQTRTFTVKKAK